MAKQYPWALVGPWYRAESVGGTPVGRATAPIIQKYATADFANQIVKEPQESLKFNCEDFATRICLDPDQVVTPEIRKLNPEPFKLFLDVQSRFYVVVCELHCVAPGFPNVNRGQVCEAGFVVRRRIPNIPEVAREVLADTIRTRNLLKSQILATSGVRQLGSDALQVTVGGLIKRKFTEMADSFQQNRLNSLLKQLDENSTQLQLLAEKYDLALALQGWQPSEHDGVGAWVNVEDFPKSLTEHVYPLYPLIADSNDAAQSAAAGTLWFGVIPTGSSQVDSQGNSMFNENELYEVQCFVRRHKPECAKERNESDCSGEIVWSKPTESYQLASYYDLDGGDHKPINIKLPDLNALKNQADLGPPGRGVNVRMIAPSGSMLKFDTNKMDMPTPADPATNVGGQICFFAIFLFFIVAMFLFQLFLPIILFLFQLWFLLKLKFCIPPSIEIGGGLAAQLKVQGPNIKADADFEIDFDGTIYTKTNKDELKEKVAEMVSNEVNANQSLKDDIQNELESSLGLDDLIDLYVTIKTDYSDDPEFEELAGELPSPESGLVYFKRVAVA